MTPLTLRLLLVASLALLTLLPSTVHAAFSPGTRLLLTTPRSSLFQSPRPRHLGLHELFAAVPDPAPAGDKLPTGPSAASPSRREMMKSLASAPSSLILAVAASQTLDLALPPSLRSAALAAVELGTASRPIAVIGGGGRTGMAVVEALAGELGQMHAATLTRSGRDPFKVIKLPAAVKENVVHYPLSVDVRSESSVLAALKEINPSGVVFAASASKQGGNAMEVDSAGVGNVARAAQAVGARLVVISALALDRPDSKSYQVTNTMGGYIDRIMDAKLEGEEMVRTVMGRGTGAYVVVRPGVLLSGKTRGGPLDVELNQGDTVGGGLSRDELAGVVVGAIQCGKRGVTVEAYRAKTATKLQPEFAVPSGNELRASTYVGLFDGAKNDS